MGMEKSIIGLFRVADQARLCRRTLSTMFMRSGVAGHQSADQTLGGVSTREGSVRLKHSSPPGSMMCRSKLTLSGAIQTTGMHPILRSRQIGEDVNGREGADERVVAPMLPLHLMHVIIVPVR